MIPDFNLADFGPINLVVLQTTSFCNLDCDYCYLPHREQKNQLSLDLIHPIFKTILTSPFVQRDFTVCWHAGEPLAVPISFYESAFELIEEASQIYNPKSYKIWQSVQTNATLINQKWCDLFKKHDVLVGVSLDGPDFIHDAHRKTRKGTGSHQSAMRGISLLQKNDIPVYLITVLTEQSLDYPDEIFNFFIENNLTDVGFNLEETEGIHQSSSLANRELENRYKAFIKRIWDLTAENQGQFKIREFENLGSVIYNDCRLDKTDMNSPFVIVSVDYQGNFSTFDPELLSVKTKDYGDFILGHVLTDSLESVCATEKFRKIYHDMKAGVEQCQQTCQYFGVCGGGAGSNKYWENGTFTSTETHACRYRTQIITDVILEELEKIYHI
ncbi:cyclophane-forming radical SAM/SPASM peptide maturase GrrM/OscB [Planktothrix mougeotii]|uniref:GRRM system radical SAM/SPASM domain protein n=1 Tax=Planktothrix mougeotii LEGE 06226 TaxID=1828728 RepID=A0ABR9U9R0_9CYAN|nr:cyclophane-forming radical SAM/SPASM peptide maturase GrrM/OscB [Planktothrix mougeotii]MBE9143181.1 GRRM system radical SAM/SPASM domain protein [Planktothrix mougeotii LEGE 06226]